eukprot:scaffold319263_cov39-Tisochrysis_lutea.AAC.1
MGFFSMSYTLNKSASATYVYPYPTGWMVSREEPTPGGAGRWLEFWRLRADDMEGARMYSALSFLAARVDLSELISPKGYPAERHKVLTRDGFVLTNFRIPYGRSGPGGKASPGSGADRQPVLLIHGISLSSTCWVINDPDESLGFILADEARDVKKGCQHRMSAQNVRKARNVDKGSAHVQTSLTHLDQHHIYFER